MSVEEDAQALVRSAGDDLTVAQAQDLLLSIADLVGSRPRSVQGPGPFLVWKLGERGLAVGVSTFRGRLRPYVDAFDWEQQDDEDYRTFESMGMEDVPYLWRFPIAGGSQWSPGEQVATSWSTFFRAFGAGMTRLPGQLALLPPAWLPTGPLVTSLWNIEGSRTGGVMVEVSVTGAVVSGEAPDGYWFSLDIPAARLDSGEISVPAILAGMTATGDYREMAFFDNQLHPQLSRESVFPVGVRENDSWIDPEEVETGVQPPSMQTVDEVQALLAPPAVEQPAPPAPDPQPTPGPASAPAAEPAVPPSTTWAPPAPPPAPSAPPAPPAPAAKPDRKPFWRRRPKGRVNAFTPTMPVTHALELATQLASNNHDSPAVLAAWKVVLGENGREVLNLGLVGCRQDGEGYRVWVELMPTGRDLNDAVGALTYAQELTAAIGQRYGPPAAIWAEEGQWGNWAWKVGEVGLAVQVDARGVTIAVLPDGDGLLQHLRNGANGTR